MYGCSRYLGTLNSITNLIKCTAHALHTFNQSCTFWTKGVVFKISLKKRQNVTTEHKIYTNCTIHKYTIEIGRWNQQLKSTFNIDHLERAQPLISHGNSRTHGDSLGIARTHLWDYVVVSPHLLQYWRKHSSSAKPKSPKLLTHRISCGGSQSTRNTRIHYGRHDKH